MGRLIPCRIGVRVEINPSEDPRKVLAAVLNIIPYCGAEIQGRLIQAHAQDISVLDTIRKSLSSRQELPALRRSIERNAHGTTTSLLLNKQAAYAGVAAICDTPEESPLGPIRVELESRRMDELVAEIGSYV